MMTEGSAGRLLSHSILGSLASPHPPPSLCKKWRRLMAFPEWVGGVCGKVPLVELKTLLECTHTSREFIFLLSSWLFLAQNDRKLCLWTKSLVCSGKCNYYCSQNPRFYYLSLTAHSQNFFLVLSRQGLESKMCITMFEIVFGEKMLQLPSRL